MRSKRKYIYVIAIILIIVIIAIPITLQVEYCAPYRYCQKCLLSNQEYFDTLPMYIRDYGLNGHIYRKDENNPEEIREILDSLNKQYQKDSFYPVFDEIVVDYDQKGNLAFSIQAKRDRLKNGNGIETPDIRSYYLVYVDTNYSGSIHAKDKAPFYANWRIWSSDSFSG
ncbi:MAG: hypothetical protein IK990_05975 [Ruminiclostridium sp.]|nr:hypothetical protein [Ruminiclostridium sp.]